MKYLKSALLLFCVLGIGMAFYSKSSEDIPARNTQDFNFDWKFYEGDQSEAYQTNFNDKDWRNVRLPHDWSVEHEFTQENTAAATAFLPGGIGWYRKTFHVPSESKDKVTWISFDGVYTNSEVWINGEKLGKRPYGYSPFNYDLTKYLKYGTENVIAVKVDRSAYIDCRWYPGSGIYRDVKLTTANKVHIPEWGTFVTTPKISDKEATVNVKVDIVNTDGTESKISQRNAIYYKDKLISEVSKDLVITANTQIDQNITLKKPKLWDIDTPHLYTMVSEIIKDGEILDRKETTFGVREFHFDREKGFFLNGKNRLIKGVCLHHDGGLVGAAVPKGVWKRRLETLKESGCNAIRTAHNPPSAEFLDLCDEMGFLVQDEAFDEWYNPKDKRHNYNQQESSPLTKGYSEHFGEWAEADLKNMVLRDRNHPSIIMWSIGNEIEWTYPRYGNATGYWGANKVGDVNYYYDEPALSVEQIKKNFEASSPKNVPLAETAKQLSAWTKEVDTTRPVTANLVIPSVSNFSGYAEALDLVGLSYRQSVYDYSYRNYKDFTFMGTENWVQYHEWKHVIDKPYISGIFLWTGIDYMGESSKWPNRGVTSGMLDYAGFKKPSYHMFKSLWSDEPHVYITTQTLEKSPYKWDAKSQKVIEKEEGWAERKQWYWQDVNPYWSYQDGEEIAVEVYTNQEAVELFLNDKSLGVQRLSANDDHVLKWKVKYTSGVLTAKAVEGGKGKYTVKTPSSFKQLLVKVDETKLTANAYDVAHIIVQLADEKGNPIQHEEQEVIFHIEGEARLLGVDNGAVTNIQKYQNDRLVTSRGKAMMILQSTKTPSKVRVKVTSGDISSEYVDIEIGELVQ